VVRFVVTLQVLTFMLLERREVFGRLRLLLIIIIMVVLLPLVSGSTLVINSSGTYCGGYVYDSVVINNSAVVTLCAYNGIGLNGSLIFTTTNFTLKRGSSINGNSKGYNATLGPGNGSTETAFQATGGGAGHAGSGGNGAYGGTGGVSYDNNLNVLYAGSGGGNAYAGSGGRGGGYLDVSSTGIANINGSISMNGDVGQSDGYCGSSNTCGAGGGSGGGVRIKASTLLGNMTINAIGGEGGSGVFGGGGGAGGMIELLFCSNNTITNLNVDYGNGGHSGDGYDGSSGNVGSTYFNRFNTFSCIYGGQCNYDIDCSFNCNITTSASLNHANVTFSGNGYVELFANITGWNRISIMNSCRVSLMNLFARLFGG